MAGSGRILGIGTVVAGLCLAAEPVRAAPKISEATQYYTVSGKTAAELIWDMNRRGPKHGFLTKATALTRVEPDFRGDFVHDNGVCRTVGAGFGLKLTYTYPQPKTKLSGDLARRWRVFSASLVRHEQTHGRMAKKMAAEVDRTLRSLSMKDRPGCNKTVARMRKEIDAIVKAHDKAQKAFDAAEHRAGGPVEKAVLAFIGTR